MLTYYPKNESDDLAEGSCLYRLLKHHESGELDEGLIDHLIRLNKIPGVLTRYSCAGHPEKHAAPFVILSLPPGLSNNFHKSIERIIMSAPIGMDVEFRYTRGRYSTDAEDLLETFHERVWVSFYPCPATDLTFAEGFIYLAEVLERLHKRAEEKMERLEKAIAVQDARIERQLKEIKKTRTSW